MTRQGFTLLELVVVLAVLGVVLGITGAAVTSLRVPTGTRQTATDQARIAAIRSGRPVRLAGFLALPDGRVFAPHVDPLSGTTHANQ